MGTSDDVARSRHLDALTGIRGFAAWYVVVYHLRLTLVGHLPAWAMAAAGKGYLAVDLFFILSGFVLWYNYADRLRDAGMDAVIRFWWKRIARIWPLHATILAAFVTFALVLVAEGKINVHYPFAELPLHVLLIQNWGFTTALSWNDPAWSISCELAAYLTFPLVVRLAWRNRVPTAALLAMGMGLAAAIWLIFTWAGTDRLGFDITHLGLARCLAEFSMGNVVCALWLRWRHNRAAAALAGVAGLAVLITGIACSIPETAFVPIGLAIVILALALDHGPCARWLGRGIPHYLGQISYSTYLAHFLLFALFKLAFVHERISGHPVMGFGQLIMFVFLLLCASGVLYHGLERPAQRWLNARPPIRRKPMVAI